MAKKMTNKPKMWRRLANKISMTIPTKQVVKDENGNESEIVVPVKIPLTGDQLRYANRMKVGAKSPGSDLLHSMMKRGGFLIENTGDVTINNVQ